MTTYVAFIRAINVAGHAIVKMTDLKDTFASAGCQAVRTYIQSGNVIFDVPEQDKELVFKKILKNLRELIAAEPTVLFRTMRELDRMVRENPFNDFEIDPDAKLYVAFLSRKPITKPNLPLHSPKEALEAIKIKNLQVFILSHRKQNGFYGFPNNFIEKELRVLATSRNWSTVTQIAKLSS